MRWLLRLIFIRILGRWALGLLTLWGFVQLLRDSDGRREAARAAAARSARRRRSS